MKRSSAEELKAEILSNLGRENLVSGTVLHSVAKQPPSDQLAIGFSRLPGSKADFAVELRVQRPEGRAFKIAESYREENIKEVRLQIVEKVELLPYVSDLPKPNSAAKLPMKKPANRRAVRIGLSISRLDTDAGTIGGFVSVDGRDEYFVLSCNHVLANMNAGKKGDDIYHPGKPDQKPLGSKYRMAKYDECIDLSTKDLNQSDAALAQLNEDVEHETTIIPAGLPDAGKKLKAFVGDPFDDFDQNQKLCKIGRTTGHTRGKVTAVGLGPLPVFTSLGKMLFSEVVEVVGDEGLFSDAGDSGSLAYTPNHEAIGLVFAGGPVKRENGTTETVSYVCLLAGILDYFDAKLV